MIGRDAELAWLDGLLDEARAGMPRTVVIGGEAGIGKSRLIREFALRAGDSARVVVGQCVDLGSVAAPYSPIKAALRTLVAEIGAERALEVVGPGRGAFVALLPELAPAGDPAQAGAVAGGAGASGQLHEAVAVLLETVAREHPLVFVVEDLHWIDPASLAMLRFLVRMLTSSRVLVVLSYRTEDVTRGHLLRPFLAELERDRWVDRRELERLSRDEVRELAASLVGDAPGEAPSDAVVDTLFRRSDGVPFFVEEVVGLDGCRDEGELPDTLRELLLARYERLSDPAQQLLRLIATGGVRVAHPMLTRVFRGGDDALDEAAREAVLGGVLVVDGEDYGFRHALVREAILADILPGERARYHARYAEAYESLAEAAGGKRRLAAEISFHWLGANDAVRAFPATVQAVREARGASAFASAAQLGERALALWDVVPDAEQIAGMSRSEFMGRTASNLRNAGEIERSLAVIKAAIAETDRDDPNYPRLLRDKALILANAGRPGSIPLLREALAMLGDEGVEELRASVLSALGGRLMVAGQLEEAMEFASAARELALRTASARTASVAENILAISTGHLGDPDAAFEGLERARELAQGDGSAMLRYWVNASDHHYLVGHFERAIELAEEGLARAKAAGLERSSGVLLASNAVDPLFAMGEWQRGLELLERGLSLDPPAPFRLYLVRAKIWAALWQGDVETAEREFRVMRPSVVDFAQVESQTRHGVGRLATELALARGDVLGAWHEGRLLLEDPISPPPAYGLPFAWPLARTIAAARSGAGAANEVDAAALAEAAGAETRLRELVARYGWFPLHPIWSAFVEAELAVGSEPAAVVDAWRAAADAAVDPAAIGLLHPYALLRLGEAELAAGDRTAARHTLQSARDEAEERGVGAVLASVIRVASAAGLALDGGGAGRASGVTDAVAAQAEAAAELTARERQVLELIAEGLSNRQIGERLFISGKTASVHVSAILRKLGAATRTEAVYRAGVRR